MTDYFNAHGTIPEWLIQEILTYLPPNQRDRVLLYIPPFWDRDREQALRDLEREPTT